MTARFCASWPLPPQVLLHSPSSAHTSRTQSTGHGEMSGHSSRVSSSESQLAPPWSATCVTGRVRFCVPALGSPHNAVHVDLGKQR